LVSSKGIKLKDNRFRLDIRKMYFRVRVVDHWNRLPRDVIDGLSLKIFKARVDQALGTLM